MAFMVFNTLIKDGGVWLMDFFPTPVMAGLERNILHTGLVFETGSYEGILKDCLGYLNIFF